MVTLLVQLCCRPTFSECSRASSCCGEHEDLGFPSDRPMFGPRFHHCQTTDYTAPQQGNCGFELAEASPSRDRFLCKMAKGFSAGIRHLHLFDTQHLPHVASFALPLTWAVFGCPSEGVTLNQRMQPLFPTKLSRDSVHSGPSLSANSRFSNLRATRGG